MYNRRYAAYHIETDGGLFVFFLSLLIYFRLSEIILGLPQDIIGIVYLFIVGFVLIFVFSIIQSIYRHLQWRKVWITYWTTIVCLLQSNRRQLDELEDIGFTLLFFPVVDGYAPWHIEAEKLAENYEFPLDDYRNYEDVEYINWYHRTVTKLSSIKQEILDEYPILQSFKEEVTMLEGKKIPKDDFLRLLRTSFLLDALNKIQKWPELFKTLYQIADIDLNELKVGDKAEVMKIAAEQRHRLFNTPSVPVSSALKILTTIFLTSLSLLPLFISYFYALI